MHYTLCLVAFILLNSVVPVQSALPLDSQAPAGPLDDIDQLDLSQLPEVPQDILEKVMKEIDQ